jgi:RNase P/RNase MRP subunit POP5
MRGLFQMKALKPSMKENKRYLLVKGKNLKQNIEKAIFDFIGVLGMSKTGMSWIKSDANSAVICLNREAVNSVRASLAVWPEKMEIVKISGTLKSLGKK